jgi:hypothetical protein
MSQLISILSTRPAILAEQLIESKKRIEDIKRDLPTVAASLDLPMNRSGDPMGEFDVTP